VARKKLGEILIQAGVIDEVKLRAALSEQQRWGGQLGKILIEMKLCSEEALVQALSHQLNFPAVRLDGRDVPRKALDLVPIETCEQHALMPFGIDGKFLDVAMADPTNLAVIDELRIRTRLNVRAYLAGPRAIDRAITEHYRGEDVPAPEPGSGEIALTSLSEFGNPGSAFAPQPFLGAEVPGPSASPAPAPRAGPAPRALSAPLPTAAPPPVPARPAAAPVPALALDETVALRARIEQLEALLARDEDVLRKLMGLLIRKGICTREEILEQLK